MAEAKELYKKMLTDFAGEVLSGPLSQKMPENCDTESHISTGINTPPQESGKLNEDNFAKSLAREYAKELAEEVGVKLDPLNWACSKCEIEAKAVIIWLLRRYCLVEKEKATDLCRLTLEHGDSVDYGLIDSLTDLVLEVFPEQYHRVADNPEIAKEVEG